MTTLHNLEKLIQMATIEQMYSMLQKLSPNINNNIGLNLNNNELSNIKLLIDTLNYENNMQTKEIDMLKSKISQLENIIEHKTHVDIRLLSARISDLESTLLETKNNSDTLSTNTKSFWF
jgi:predicted RNase H-like nuclease (RuvC/YqgF family)